MSDLSTKPLIIVSRGSALAKWQAEYVKSLLAREGVTASIEFVKTTGDRVQNRFLHEIGGKGVFVRELENALSAGTADLAVHSLKDLPARTPQGYRLAAILPRHASGDVIVFHPDFAHAHGLASLEGSQSDFSADDLRALGVLTIGTGSLRRSCLLRNANPDANVVPIRGNVDTRVAKLRAGNWDAIVLAAASLERLPVAQGLVSLRLDPQWFVPSASQGALVVETLAGHPRAEWLRQVLGCNETSFRTQVERDVLAALGGDCTMPVGVHAEVFKDASGIQTCCVRAVVLDHHGQEARVAWGPKVLPPDPTKVSEEVLLALLGNGANDVLQSLGLPTVTAPR